MLDWRASPLLTALVAVPVVVTSCVYAYHAYLSVPRKGEAPVRWSWLAILGHALELGARPVELFRESADVMGEVFGLVLGGNRLFIISDVHSANLILRPRSGLSSAEFHDQLLVDFFGVDKNVIAKHSLDEPLMRKFYSSYLLSEKRLAVLSCRMFEQLSRNSAILDENLKKAGSSAGVGIGLSRFLNEFIFDASVAALFNPDAATVPGLYDAFCSFDQTLPLAAAGVSLEYQTKAKTARLLLAKTASQYKAETLSEFMKVRQIHFEKLIADGVIPEGQLGFLQNAMLWASVGNTMPATFWAIYYLILNPQAMEEVKREVEINAPRLAAAVRESDGELSSELVNQSELDAMVFIDAVVTETLRLASGSLIMRVAQEDLSLTLDSGNTYSFRKGDRVGICPPLFHGDEDIFPEARKFNPWRWMVGETPEQRAEAVLGKMPLSKNGRELESNAVYLPFGAGITYCPGRRFARSEIKLLLCFLTQRFNFKLSCPNAPPPVVDGSRAGIGIFPPKDEVLVDISRASHHN